MTHAIAERLAGSARVSKIWIKTAAEHQGLLLVVSVLMFVMGVMIGPMYNLIDDALISLSENMPERLLAIFGGGDMSTPEGFYQIEVFGLMAPIAVLVVTGAIGAGAVAGEEKRHTMGLLLANPIPRSTIVFQNTITMLLYGVIAGVATFAGVAAGSLIGSLDMSMGNIAATCALVTLLGMALGALALLLGASTGRTDIAGYGTAGVAIVAFVANALLPLNDEVAGWARLSPFHYYLGGDPLLNGMPWGHSLVLVVLTVLLTAGSVVMFQRRDLR